MNKIRKPIISPKKIPSKKEVKSETSDAELTFDRCFDLITKFNNFEVGFLVHENLMKSLISKIENKTLTMYLLKEIDNSKFKSFTLGVKTFKNIINSYYEGNSTIEDLKTFYDNIPTYSSEILYEHFNLLKRSIILGISNKNREECFGRCFEIFRVIQTINVDYDISNVTLEKYSEDQEKIKTKQIIDLMELIWPERGGTLQILFGDK